jgi:hypothetical protein
MALLSRSVLVAFALGPVVSHSAKMDCGSGVPLCGILTLESGLGDGFYKHKQASVHGLWPESGAYGTSQCIAPKDPADATKIYDCYKNEEAAADSSHQLAFINHEWEKHGRCAGVDNVDDFFGQVCALSAAPVAVIEKAKESGTTFDAVVDAVKKSGYPVFGVDAGEDQIELSVCSGPKSGNKWVVSPVSEFQAKCGGGSPAPAPAPGPSPPAPSPSTSTCVTGKRGPACSSNGDCTGVSGCTRCARSGYCTDVPLAARNLDVIV